MAGRKRKDSSSSFNKPDSLGNECRKTSKIDIKEASGISSEAKDAQKLDQESCYLTDTNNLFPEFVWRKVVKKLKKPEDINNCSNASPYFRHLLRDKQINQVVIPSVLGVLAKCYESFDNNDNTSPYKETNVECIPWQRSQNDNDNKTYQMTGLLKSRLVCKSWNTAIQSNYENFPRFQFKMDFNQSKESFIEAQATERFSQEGTVINPQKFLHHFDPTHYDYLEDKPKKNPFMGRCVNITNYRNENDFQHYFDGILEILQKYGKEVWYFRLICYDEVEGPPWQLSEFYRELKQMIEQMSSLKLIYIGLYRRRGRARNSLGIPRNWPTADELQALEQAIHGNPFPKLPNLKFLSTEYIPTLVFNQIVTQNEHITQLEVRRQSFHGSYLIFSDYLLNLRELSVDICTQSDLKKFENCPAPLNLEKLHFYCEETVNFVPWSQIFTAIEKSLNTEVCTELILRLPKPNRDHERLTVLGESLGYKLNLPKLKSFTIYEDTPFCLDFLLPSKNSLREITIRSKNISSRRVSRAANKQHTNEEERDKFEKRQIIKFLGCEDKIQESNLSAELPSLKSLTLMRHEKLGGSVRYEYEKDRIKICKLVN